MLEDRACDRDARNRTRIDRPIDQIERAPRQPAAARLLARMAVVDDRDPRAARASRYAAHAPAGPAPTIPISALIFPGPPNTLDP